MLYLVPKKYEELDDNPRIEENRKIENFSKDNYAELILEHIKNKYQIRFKQEESAKQRLLEEKTQLLEKLQCLQVALDEANRKYKDLIQKAKIQSSKIKENEESNREAKQLIIKLERQNKKLKESEKEKEIRLQCLQVTLDDVNRKNKDLIQDIVQRNRIKENEEKKVFYVAPADVNTSGRSRIVLPDYLREHVRDGLEQVIKIFSVEKDRKEAEMLYINMIRNENELKKILKDKFKLPSGSPSKNEKIDYQMFKETVPENIISRAILKDFLKNQKAAWEYLILKTSFETLKILTNPEQKLHRRKIQPML